MNDGESAATTSSPVNGASAPAVARLPTLADTKLAELPDEASLADLQQFEGHIRTLPNLVLPETRNHFSSGVYLREVLLNAGTLIVGKLHKTRHFLLVTRGRIQSRTNAGMVDLVASDIVEILPGMKLVMLALEDSTIVAVHVTDKTDLAEIERDVIEPELPTQGEAA